MEGSHHHQQTSHWWGILYLRSRSSHKRKLHSCLGLAAGVVLYRTRFTTKWSRSLQDRIKALIFLLGFYLHFIFRGTQEGLINRAFCHSINKKAIFTKWTFNFCHAWQELPGPSEGRRAHRPSAEFIQRENTVPWPPKASQAEICGFSVTFDTLWQLLYFWPWLPGKTF